MKVLSISVSLCLALAGCNMMAGLGDDMQQAGVNLRQRATEAQPNGTPDYGSEGIYNAPQTMTYPTSPQPQYTSPQPQYTSPQPQYTQQ